MAKITVVAAKQEKLAKENIKKAVGNLQQMNSLIAGKVSENNVHSAKNDETIENLMKQQVEIKEANEAHEEVMKQNNLVIEQLESHI